MILAWSCFKIKRSAEVRGGGGAGGGGGTLLGEWEHNKNERL